MGAADRMGWAHVDYVTMANRESSNLKKHEQRKNRVKTVRISPKCMA